jgi:hypothetical protein
MDEASRWVVFLDLAAEDRKLPLLTHHLIEARAVICRLTEKMVLRFLRFFFFWDISQAF